MKYMSKWYIACLAMALCCLASACSEKEEQIPVEVSFTEPGEFDMAALDSCESIIGSFELTSNGDWSLYSDKMWVKLSLERDGWYFNDLKGGEGVYIVYIKVTNDALDFNDAQATVSLVAGEKTQNVVTIHRKGLERSFALLSSDGEVIDRIEIGTDASVWVTPDANFECSILSCPDWLAEPEAFEGGYTLNVAQAFIPYEKEGVVTFGNIDGSVVFEVPVSYTGMDSTVIRIEGESTPWNWKVSPDGKTFVQEASSASGENVETVIENALVFSVTCFNYDYKLVSLQVDNGKLAMMDADESWIIASQGEDEPSKVSVSVDSLLSGSREGYLFALPVALYDNFIDSLALSSDVDTFIDSNVNYVVAEIEQKDLAGSDGFVITDSNGTKVSCATESEYYEWLCSEYSITDLTTCNLVPGESYTIETRLNTSEWQGNFALENVDDRKSVRLSSWGIKNNNNPVLGDDGLYRFNITVPASLNKTVILRLYTPQIVNLKAIVIRPVTQ